MRNLFLLSLTLLSVQSFSSEYVLKVNSDLSTLKVDPYGDWVFDSYIFENIKQPVFHSESNYLPLIVDQEQPFNQSKTMTYLIERDKVEVLINTSTQIKKNGVSEKEQIFDNQSISRSIVPSIIDWTNSGQADCGNWTPNASTVMEGTEFEQLKQCIQQQTKQINYFSNEELIDQKLFTRSNTYNLTQLSVGTKIPENLTPASSGQKINLLNSSITEWSNKAIINGRMFNGTYNVYSDQECISLGESGTHYVDFTVSEPLKMTIIGNTEYPLYSNGRKLSLSLHSNPNATLKQITLTSNGSAQILDYLLLPNTVYRLKGGSTVFCEIGAIQ